MESHEFIDRLCSEVTLEAIDYASDVERILAEQVVYLRDRLGGLRQDSVLGSHELVNQLYRRLDDKDRQISDLRDEVRFLREQLGHAAS